MSKLNPVVCEESKNCGNETCRHSMIHYIGEGNDLGHCSTVGHMTKCKHELEVVNQ